MNRFFDDEGWWGGFPKRAYAKIDDIEPIFPHADDPLTFVLDSVNADWEGFGDKGPFDLAAPDLASQMEQRWRRRFEAGADDGPDPYDNVPVYRIEITLPPNHQLLEVLLRDEESWITLQLTDQETDVPVNVYGGLFAPPIRAFLRFASRAATQAAALSEIFDMKHWRNATPTQLLEALRPPECDLESLVCFDIGQGSSSALVCKCGNPIYYFDVGCGSGRNAPTCPPMVDFCTRFKPPIILSHWDTDHWAGAKKQKALHKLVWIVPRQSISTSHILLGNDILAAGGSIFVVGHCAPPLQWQGQSQNYDLRRCTGRRRNGTGLALVVTDQRSGRSWVLTGDAGYNVIPQGAPTDVAAMVVPHHGADMGPLSVPFHRSARSDSRLLYSFGPGNGHGPNRPPVQHPVKAAVLSHIKERWSHGQWTPAAPATCLAGGDVLATATHPTSHLGGTAATWTGTRPALLHLQSCPNALPVTQW